MQDTIPPSNWKLHNSLKGASVVKALNLLDKWTSIIYVSFLSLAVHSFIKIHRVVLSSEFRIDCSIFLICTTLTIYLNFTYFMQDLLLFHFWSCMEICELYCQEKSKDKGV
ncbi:hypothetical protein Gasu2_59380 [Galdieria sulphuraria]|uniref:Uncharacterized protein n=1 Tax=Galdieria sulphuraria TaxID=130081 RepID=M2XQU6_GALSU|nr:uncharacterized protein Gasu_64280 [Galdieria sulphuraria]XP_005702533.1 uncharacterized protein Gasu_63320 [Galdieria sulphuraria]EME25912.1 hypothetical protein Gasu_64280 [Galdieria sulphuraria]EME26013.1 hypothetical protein Gasu_63320 [Galdieria sulphuraria]GJD11813.1 hypothetical protein Gasu2_59380 [Galdieria sulphuraria]|eukprot:XP_005702432.1 hypothetical protein Gasu_64280 [Galdieria sulphuraria]